MHSHDCCDQGGFCPFIFCYSTGQLRKLSCQLLLLFSDHMIYVVSSFLEVKTLWYSLSKEKTSLSSLGEEQLILFFAGRGNLHGKQRPWQLPCSGEMAQKLFAFFWSKTSETRLWDPVWSWIIWIDWFCNWKFFGRDASVHLQKEMMREVVQCCSFWSNSKDFKKQNFLLVWAANNENLSTHQALWNVSKQQLKLIAV